MPRNPLADQLYFSERNIPLVYYGPPPKEPLLTIENYHKWYDIYVVHPDGTAGVIPEQAVRELESELTGSTWCDHVPHPEFCLALEEKLGWKWHDESFEMIVGRYVTETCETEYQPSYRTPPREYSLFALDWHDDDNKQSLL